MSLSEAIGLACGILGTISGLVWAGIKYWFTQQARIKELESANVLKSISDLEDQIVQHKHSIRAHSLVIENVKTVIQGVKEDLIKSGMKIDQTSKMDEQLLKSVEYMKTFVETKIQVFNDTLSDGEIIRLGEKGNRFMFKGRKKD